MVASPEQQSLANKWKDQSKGVHIHNLSTAMLTLAN
jgi:hypothetical protein